MEVIPLKLKTRFILLSMLLACAAMSLIEAVLMPPYALKILLRVLLFAGAPAVYFLRFPEESPRELFSSASLCMALFLAAGSFLVLLGGFFQLRAFIDLDAIAAGLTENQNITRDNFLFVALYICLCNSFLEELFFRGFGYLTLRRHWGEGPAQGFSAAAFALYHVTILSGWFPLWLFALLVAGLFVCGILFNLLDRKGSLFPAWLLHASANAAINLIGFFMFGWI